MSERARDRERERGRQRERERETERELYVLAPGLGFGYRGLRFGSEVFSQPVVFGAGGISARLDGSGFQVYNRAAQFQSSQTKAYKIKIEILTPKP